MAHFYEDRLFESADEVAPRPARRRPSPGKVSLTMGLPSPLLRADARVVQAKADPAAPAARAGSVAPATPSAMPDMGPCFGIVAGAPASGGVVQRKEASGHDGAPVQKKEVYGERQTVDERWEDATAGLTRRQHGDLSTSLRWTGNIFSHAVMPRPQWQLLMDQCDMLERDIAAMLGQITSRAAAALAPALGAVNATRGYIDGARKPEPEVRDKASSHLVGAALALEQLIEYGVWVDDTGRVRVNSDEDMDALLDSARPEPAESSEGQDGESRASDDDNMYPYTIPGTQVEIVSEAGEDEFRSTHKPLSDDQKSYGMRIKKLMVKDGLRFDGDGKVSTLKDMETQLRGALMLMDDLMKDGVGDKARVVLEGAKAKIDKAHKMVVAKLATTLPDALGHVQRGAAQIENGIRTTLALRPFKVDPDWPEDNDGDGEVDRPPHLDTRGIRNDDEVTQIYPEHTPADTGNDIPDNAPAPGDASGPSGELVVPATGGV